MQISSSFSHAKVLLEFRGGRIRCFTGLGNVFGVVLELVMLW